MALEKPRSVEKTLHSKKQPEGDGALVWRSIGRPELGTLDPFLLLDEALVKLPNGFPDHPHRGFETVTYMLQGKFSHEDFEGNEGILDTGDLQWMTAGRGIMHSEMPATFEDNRGLQLWVNLAAKEKMCEPGYQDLKDAEIPRKEQDGVHVKVIAGTSMGISSPVKTKTPTMYLDFTLQPGSHFAQEIPNEWNAFAYVLEGAVTFVKESLAEIGGHTTVIFDRGGNGIEFWNKGKDVARFVLIGGQPLNEPVVQHGPFVMNSKDEIRKTMMDFQFGTNGFEKAPGWRSKNRKNKYMQKTM